MVITKNINGYIVISDIIDGYRVQKSYGGYTKKDAIKLFKESNKQNHE